MTSDETRLFRKALERAQASQCGERPEPDPGFRLCGLWAAPEYASHMHVLNVAVPENFITLPIMTSKVAARRRCLG